MKILYFGTYSKGPGYPRNNAIIKGLRKNGFTVVECNREIFCGADEKVLAAKSPLAVIKLLFRISKTYCFLIARFFQIGKYDLLLVGYLGHFDIFLARFLNAFTRNRMVALDAFLSLFDSVVLDRRLASSSSIRARFLWSVDKFACRFADIVLLDTKKHIEFFCDEFDLPQDKFIRVFVGDDERKRLKLASRKPSLYDRPFSVLFFGTYLPLHGIDYILKAANLLKYDKEISFTLVGNGPGYKNMRSLATELGLDNTHFVTEWTEEETLMAYIRHASICLGIFGDTLKAARVIPCKVFNCLRQGKPIVTGDSQAARELLTHKKDAYLCSQADEKSIAKAIKALKNDLELRIAIGENALKTYKQQGSPEAIGKHLGEEITKRVFARGPER